MSTHLVKTGTPLSQRLGLALSLLTALSAVLPTQTMARVSDADFVSLALAIGTIVDDSLVRVVPGKRTYLANPAPIPLHTDHPKADLIAWRCEAQDASDGASVLVDGRTAIHQLDSQSRQALRDTLLPAMVRLGDEPQPTPIVSGDHGAAAPTASRRSPTTNA